MIRLRKCIMLVLGTRDYVHKSGFSKVVIGLRRDRLGTGRAAGG